MSSKFNHEQNEHESYPWLEEKVYAKLRQRTIDLVKRSVDALRKNKQRVSLSMVATNPKSSTKMGFPRVPFSTIRRPGPTTNNIVHGKETVNDE